MNIKPVFDKEMYCFTIPKWQTKIEYCFFKNRFYAALKIFILALHWVPPGKALILRSSEILVNYAFHIGLFNMEIILFDIGKNIVYF